LEGKGREGRGQGRYLATLGKPLPLTRVSGVSIYYVFSIYTRFKANFVNNSMKTYLIQTVIM
jgi:hypothetical protein